MVESNWKSQYYWFKMSFSFETGVIVVLGFGFSAFFLGGGGLEVVKGVFLHCLNSVRFSVQLSSTFKPLLDLDAECCANR